MKIYDNIYEELKKRGIDADKKYDLIYFKEDEDEDGIRRYIGDLIEEVENNK